MNGIRYSATTHTGLVRDVNEDSVLALEADGIWVVSDGMGGHEAGDFASQTVTEAIAMLPAGLTAAERMHETRRAIYRAHEAIRVEAARRGTETIGATVVALLIADQHFAAFWAGDSRLYRLRDRALEMLSTDHSAVAEIVAAGRATWDEAEDLPQSNVITRAVGVGKDLELDKVRGEVAPGDRFLLCSDGLTKYVRSQELSRILSDAPLETVSDTLLSRALAGGGTDNISVIVVDVI